MKKPSELFSRLPSVNDLLESPQIKSLVDKANQLEITTGVRQYIDRARDELKRRKLDMPLPSIGELAERAARFIRGREKSSANETINATGEIWHPAISSPPLAEAAIDAIADAAYRYHTSEPPTELVKGVAKLAGAEAALVVGNANAALLLAMAALGGRVPITIARGELGTLEDGTRLTELAILAGATLNEVGAIEQATSGDYRDTLSPEGMLLRIESLPGTTISQLARPAASELANLARSANSIFVQFIDRNPIASKAGDLELPEASAERCLADGASLVIARGDGYFGGRCPPYDHHRRR